MTSSQTLSSSPQDAFKRSLDTIQRALPDRRDQLLLGVIVALFGLLFLRPATTLADDWWNNPEAGHGLLLFPVALWFGWKAGLEEIWRPARISAAVLILGGVSVRFLSELAAELFTMRLSMLCTFCGLVLWYMGWKQLMRWWLPILLVGLSVPLPELIISRIALPLQFFASKMGAALLEWRRIPVLLTGNVIRLQGHELFVAEACSGLRSLTALIALSVLVGGVLLRTAIGRILLVAFAVPIAVMLNGIRVFLTGFLVTMVDPKLGEGFMHITEGWLIFLIAMLILSAVAWVIGRIEDTFNTRRDSNAILA